MDRVEEIRGRVARVVDDAGIVRSGLAERIATRDVPWLLEVAQAADKLCLEMVYWLNAADLPPAVLAAEDMLEATLARLEGEHGADS